MTTVSQKLKPRLRYAIFGALLAATSVHADSSCNVQVDCSMHIMQIRGQNSRIDCGKPGHETVNGTGTIGGLHNAKVYGVEITNFPGMGNSGGGKVFHCADGKPPHVPQPQPTASNDSRGCIHVECPSVLDQLFSCQGSTLTITHAGEPSLQPTDAQLASMPAVVKQQYYGTNDPLTGVPSQNSSGDPFSTLMDALFSGASH